MRSVGRGTWGYGGCHVAMGDRFRVCGLPLLPGTHECSQIPRYSNLAALVLVCKLHVFHVTLGSSDLTGDIKGTSHRHHSWVSVTRKIFSPYTSKTKTGISKL